MGGGVDDAGRSRGGRPSGTVKCWRDNVGVGAELHVGTVATRVNGRRSGVEYNGGRWCERWRTIAG